MGIKNYLRKHWSTAAMLLVVVLLLLPQTAIPIKVAVNRVFAFSPSTENVEKAETLSDYNWNLITLDGKGVNLERSKNKVVLINLWATWCPPCIAEMPSLQALYDSYGDKVDFYFVTNNRKKPFKNLWTNTATLFLYIFKNLRHLLSLKTIVCQLRI